MTVVNRPKLILTILSFIENLVHGRILKNSFWENLPSWIVFQLESRERDKGYSSKRDWKSTTYKRLIEQIHNHPKTRAMKRQRQQSFIDGITLVDINVCEDEKWSLNYRITILKQQQKRHPYLFARIFNWVIERQPSLLEKA